jgi:uncharacterized caspase-like protein
MMRHFFGLICLTVMIWPLAAMADKRVALVIGNSKYDVVAELENPERDARAMAAKLASLGFEVIEGYDLDVFAMQQKIREFARATRVADTSLFYYAGHGLGVGDKNYIVPVDARFKDPAALEFETVELDTVMRQMHASNGVSLVFLDACRDDPAMVNAVSRSLSSGTRSVSVGQGLVAVVAPDSGKGTAIAFATSPGDVAYDGDGLHSPFTEALLKHIGQPNMSISEVMAYVTGDVREATNDRQKPWLNASLTKPVVLNRVATPQAPATVAVVPAPTAPTVGHSDLEAQKALFSVAERSGRVGDYEIYLKVFPQGLFAISAEQAIGRLRADEAEEERNIAILKARVMEPSGPPVLTVTPELKAMPANATTEQLLGMDWAKRREVQARLNLDGVNVGGADGSIGPNTRSGLKEWQIGRGLSPTGHLNGPQLQLLMARTDTAYLAWAASNPVVQRPYNPGSSSASGGKKIDPGAALAIGAGTIILKRLLRN